MGSNRRWGGEYRYLGRPRRRRANPVYSYPRARQICQLLPSMRSRIFLLQNPAKPRFGATHPPLAWGFVQACGPPAHLPGGARLIRAGWRHGLIIIGGTPRSAVFDYHDAEASLGWGVLTFLLLPLGPNLVVPRLCHVLGRGLKLRRGSCRVAWCKVGVEPSHHWKSPNGWAGPIAWLQGPVACFPASMDPCWASCYWSSVTGAALLEQCSYHIATSARKLESRRHASMPITVIHQQRGPRCNGRFVDSRYCTC
ncbi:hypothetical protein V8C35DRAFT_171725 [Trichoderma chlorosporum]